MKTINGNGVEEVISKFDESTHIYKWGFFQQITGEFKSKTN